MDLARLHSVAVDFPKTGAPAIMTKDLRPAMYPDFMEKKVSNV
jgi:RNA-dependent RNA polymerase